MTVPADDRVVTLLSSWLAGHVDDEGLDRGLQELRAAGIEPGPAAVVERLCARLVDGPGDDAGREAAVREALETLALG